MLVSLSGGSVAEVIDTFPSGRRLVRVVMKGRASHHRVGDCLVWHAAEA